MSRKLGNVGRRYGCAVVAVALAIAARLMLEPVFGERYPFATVFFAVLVTAWYGGLMPAVSAVALGALGVDYFLMQPRGSFALVGAEKALGIALYLATGLGIAMLGGVMHAARERAEENFLETKRNVTQREAAETALRESNELLEKKVVERTAALVAAKEALRGEVELRTGELKEREVLLQEVHHRVKNNLQVISSLINMQIRSLTDESTRAAFRECQSRVATMALIHEMLYRSEDYARVPFSVYAKTVAQNVFRVSGLPSATVALRCELEDVSLVVDRAIPCGLILNELIANALKHAFPDAKKGEIVVKLERLATDEIVLSVADDGVGISADIDPEVSRSLGLHLVDTLVGQLEGRLEIVREVGTTFRITFPIESLK